MSTKKKQYKKHVKKNQASSKNKNILIYNIVATALTHYLHGACLKLLKIYMEKTADGMLQYFQYKLILYFMLNHALNI